MQKLFMLVVISEIMSNTTGVISVRINHNKTFFFIQEKQETVKHCDTWQKKKVLTLFNSTEMFKYVHKPTAEGVYEPFPIYHTYITPSNQLTNLHYGTSPNAIN